MMKTHIYARHWIVCLYYNNDGQIGSIQNNHYWNMYLYFIVYLKDK